MDSRTQRRAIGIVRVSRSAGRTGESFSSPQDQADRIRVLARERGWLLTILEPHEIDVSGDALLTDRPQLSRAVAAVQSGEADIIAAAHTERLWWNHETASQVIRLVEDANGEVWSADQGLLTRRSAADEFSGTVRTAADRLARLQNKEKSEAAIQRAITRGVPPWPRVTAGYRKRTDGKYEPDPKTAPLVREAFERRARRATIREVRAFLCDRGVEITYPGVAKLLSSRVVIGEIRFGKFTPNLTAHEAIVPRATWEAVQRTRIPAGRLSKSERLLARLGVLVCGSCGSRLVVNVAFARGTPYPIYRCQNVDCERRVTISAPVAERVVEDAVRQSLAGLEGRANAEQEASEAAAGLERAQAELDAAIRTLSVVSDEPAAVERLTSLRAARDAAQGEVDRLSGLEVALRINVADDWDRLTLDERRALVRANVRCAVVRPGRGNDRVRVELFGQDAPSGGVEDAL